MPRQEKRLSRYIKSKKLCILRNLLHRTLGKVNLHILRNTTYNQILKELEKVNNCRYNESRNGFLLKFMLVVENPKKTFKLIPSSKSQLFQDLFVLEILNWKKRGYFVEFGATNGLDLSNTHLLEKEFFWTGILAEPGKNWHHQLRSNRDAYISEKCVWKTSGQMINFNESVYPEFSTIDHLTHFDGIDISRSNRKRYFVETTTLLDLLTDANAPTIIDYLSIDTEGSEYEILKEFEFSKYQFAVITVEHNHNENEIKIDELLNKNGYSRVHREVSDFDGWYLHKTLEKGYGE